ncbi:hypothetical protein L4C54_18020 [Vibrio lamellibrachiae]|uniref:hypothetical protein n=1 Tax=Vibrio lamellibrachiae TaxID=2910253 RepID=UPI003D133F27
MKPNIKNSCPYKIQWLIISFLISFIYSGVLSSLPVDVFYDRINYLYYAEKSYIIFLHNMESGLLRTFFNEPIWLLLNTALASILSPESVIRVYIFISCFLLSFSLCYANRKHFFFVMFALLFPLLIKNYIVHLRQGVAMSIFSLGYFSKNLKVKASLISLTPFIHVSFFIIIGVMALGNMVRFKGISPGVKALIGFIILLVIAILLPYIASLLGARQGERAARLSMNVSGVGFFFWMTILLVFLLSGRDAILKSLSAIFILFLYLSLYFISPFSGRVLESGLIIVLFSITLLGVRSRYTMYLLLAFWSLAMWLPRISQDYMGWGL